MQLFRKRFKKEAAAIKKELEDHENMVSSYQNMYHAQGIMDIKSA